MPGARHDWEAIKAEFISGVPTAVIAAKYRVNRNTMAAMITRKKWNLERMSDGRKKTETIIRSVHTSLANHATDFTECVVAHLIPQIKEVFKRQFPTIPHELNAHASAVQKLHDIGRKAVGLDDSNKITVQVGILGAMPAIDIQAQVSEQPTLDVSTDIDASPSVDPGSTES